MDHALLLKNAVSVRTTKAFGSRSHSTVNVRGLGLGQMRGSTAVQGE